MLALIATIFPTLTSWANLIIGFFQQRAAAQAAATGAESTSEGQHQTDGAQSVADQASTAAQNAALNTIEQNLQNPTPVVVTIGAPK